MGSNKELANSLVGKIVRLDGFLGLWHVEGVAKIAGPDGAHKSFSQVLPKHVSERWYVVLKNDVREQYALPSDVRLA